MPNTDNGEHTINWPRALLPKGTRAGDVLTFQLDRDAHATERIARRTHALQDELKKTDPWGDLKL